MVDPVEAGDDSEVVDLVEGEPVDVGNIKKHKSILFPRQKREIRREII